ncbi:MAG: class I SAM-dependent methyltransferase [Candidatus Binataceae bacterium]
MDPSLYPRMAAVEDVHWWFASRRAICDSLIARLGLTPDCEILEPGCGTGGNFAMLARHGRVYALDCEEEALRFAARRGIAAELAQGALPDRIPFGGRRFDLIVMTDVLEHLDDDTAALAALRPRLKPRGWLLLTVPAIRWLWSEHDVTHHHRRRYRAEELGARLKTAGYKISFLSHFNFVLFPIIAGMRLRQRLFNHPSAGYHDLTMPSVMTNMLLTRIFSSERHVLNLIRVPLGVSLIALARA